MSRSVYAVAVSALVVAACSGSGDTAPEPTIATTTTIAPPPRVSDGVLRIGALVPQGDAQIGIALETALRFSESAINEAGGVLGADIEVIIEDEGTTGASATAAIASLTDQGVDAIIGPSSSIAALGALDDAVAADVLTCSATATAISLDEFPDDRMFFRTIAGDSLQAIAIADEAEDTGASGVAIVHVDDAYGRPYANAVAAAFEGRQIEVVTTIAIPVADDDVTDEATELLASDATVAVVLGAPNDSARFLDALGRSEFRGLSDVIVNDAVRDAAARPVIASLPSGLRSRLTGVAPQITIDDDTELTGVPFAPQVIDCMNLIALAAVQANTDLPGNIAAQMPPVSSRGSVCTTFAQCAQQIRDELQVDYRGPTGITELNREGETSRAWFETFGFDEQGADVFARSFTVSR